MVWTQAAFMIELWIVSLDSSTSTKPWSDLDILRLVFKSDRSQCTNTRQPWDVSSQGSCKFSVRTISVSVQSLSHFRLFAAPQTAAHQGYLSIMNCWSLPKLMSIESVMPSNHLTLFLPLLFLPSIFPSIRVFSNESALHIRWPKNWSFSINISPSNEHSGCSRWESYKIQIWHLCLVSFFHCSVARSCRLFATWQLYETRLFSSPLSPSLLKLMPIV